MVLGSNQSRMASPKKLKDRTVIPNTTEGEHDHVRCIKKVVAGFAKHGAPARSRRCDTQTEKTQRRFGQNCDCHADADLYQDRLG